MRVLPGGTDWSRPHPLTRAGRVWSLWSTTPRCCRTSRTPHTGSPHSGSKSRQWCYQRRFRERCTWPGWVGHPTGRRCPWCYGTASTSPRNWTTRPSSSSKPIAVSAPISTTPARNSRPKAVTAVLQLRVATARIVAGREQRSGPDSISECRQPRSTARRSANNFTRLSRMVVAFSGLANEGFPMIPFEV
jgi:hypothetical protein